ncbi:hypothetical protein FPQ18DRAFT_287940 [Pyronema domesticum]|uniref:Uncharacterized protein n=1 Tax=Pyronema omphalodes (strain CBS 100304) TaxID=1076935 RepID=U4LU43_PYROM|nr:hypothetical protein FPQ18DRAFT_287940 [Pyronema domesticum]CCX33375.1 Similar to hypothetical protein CMQ_849 [Grosmannia clavigera kw1407]; acc. no. EFX03921 [Pyronema omphalodes CBS 100304]
MASLLRLCAVLFLASLTTANTPLSDELVQSSMFTNDTRGFEIAMASRPMWHFASMRPAFFIGQRSTCYPSSALTADGKQQGTPPNKWPDASTGCADPGPRGAGNPFPTYWNVKKCQDDEIRVIYSLYFQHDGFSNVLLAKGHMHDWERIVVSWKRNPQTGEWRRDQLLKSMHSGYQAKAWNSVQSTFTYNNTNENNGKDKDGPKIYVGWAKHPNYDTKETGWRDSISQGCQREYRSDQWWYLPTEDDMIWAAKESPEGKRMATFDWGSATGGPWVVEDDICSKKDGGYIAC